MEYSLCMYILILVVLAEQIDSYRNVFLEAASQVIQLIQFFL